MWPALIEEVPTGAVEINSFGILPRAPPVSLPPASNCSRNSSNSFRREESADYNRINAI